MLPFANYYISSPSMSENDLSSSKRRKKKRPVTVYGGGGGGGGGDDLAVVKAAAWAWYQRKEGKPIMREFEMTTRAPRRPRPSRYKIEATKNMILSENKVLAENRVSKTSLWYTNFHFREDQETQYSRLLDTYEINNISNSLNYDYGNDDHDYGSDDHGVLEKRIGYAKSTTSSRKNDKNCMKKVSLWKGMIPASRICGRSDDVDLRACKASRRTVKVSAAAESLLRSAASGKTLTGRR